MKGFFRSNAFKLLMTVVLIIGAVWILSVTTGTRTITSMFHTVTDPMSQSAVQITDKVRDKMGFSSMSREELERSYAELKEENNKLKDQMVDYYDIKKKNQQYSKALGIVEESPDIKLAAASVISRDPMDMFGGFSIDAGSLDGIEVNDPVISSDGVIGVVSEVYTSSSRVKTIFSEDVKLGATSVEFAENGVVCSDASIAADGLVKMMYLSKDTKIGVDTIITTSGAGGIFPEGIRIGSVNYLSSSQKDVSLEAAIKPSADIKNITDVFIITSFAGQGEAEPDVNLPKEENHEENQEEQE